MTDIRRKYIMDEHNKKVAVQLDIDTFETINRKGAKDRKESLRTLCNQKGTYR